MAITINGTTGIAGVDGSAGTPAVQGTDTNTGVFYPAADTVGVSTGGSERVRVDSSGNVGIGTTNTTDQRLKVKQSADTGASSFSFKVEANANDTGLYIGYRGAGAATAADTCAITATYGSTGGFKPITFLTSDAERMRIDSSGNLLVGTTSVISVGKISTAFDGSVAYGASFKTTYGSAGSTFAAFVNSGGTVQGSIYANATNTVQYLTSSDYRLKENIAPMTGALAKVSQLKPVTYNWKSDGTSSQGFIAHELAEVAPECVGGEKDAVDADGNPVYQGIDTSFLVATLTAAIQELKALVDTQASTITQLQADVAALKGTP